MRSPTTLKSLGNSLPVNLSPWTKTSANDIVISEVCRKLCLNYYALLSICEVLKFSWAHWRVISNICMVCKSEMLEPPILPWLASKSSNGIWTPLRPHLFSRSSMEWLELQRKIWTCKSHLKMTKLIMNDETLFARHPSLKSVYWQDRTMLTGIARV